MWPANDSDPADSLSADPFLLRVEEYVLRSRPQPGLDRRFFAYVVIIRDVGRHTVDLQSLGRRTVCGFMPDLPSCATALEAARAGRDAGLCWLMARARTPTARRVAAEVRQIEHCEAAV